MISIDKCVPVPDSGKYRKHQYPFQDMAVGDSFFVPKEKALSVQSAASKAGLNQSRTYVTRRVIENEAEGRRVWRIK